VQKINLQAFGTVVGPLAQRNNTGLYIPGHWPRATSAATNKPIRSLILVAESMHTSIHIPSDDRGGGHCCARRAPSCLEHSGGTVLGAEPPGLADAE
jgi:hypothetical protein